MRFLKIGREDEKPNAQGVDEMSKYTVASARKKIERNHGKVFIATKPGKFSSIRCSNPGIKVLGAIDFLVNHHGFIWVRE